MEDRRQIPSGTLSPLQPLRVAAMKALSALSEAKGWRVIAGIRTTSKTDASGCRGQANRPGLSF